MSLSAWILVTLLVVVIGVAFDLGMGLISLAQ